MPLNHGGLTYVYFCNILIFMRILPEPVTFQWDEGNIEKNFKKHVVTIQETEEVFTNEPFITAEDVKHSTNAEQRYQGLGQTKVNRKLFVAFTVRDKKIRVISIRDMKRKERQLYEWLEKNS
jgi:uncharacterized DUF497 family protein